MLFIRPIVSLLFARFDMQWLRYSAVMASLSGSLVLLVAPAWADRQCNVPAGYYRLVDPEDDGVIEFRELPSHQSHLLAALEAGEIVQSDGTRSPTAAARSPRLGSR